MSDPWSVATRQFALRFGDRTGCRSWFVPGRIEVFGKHVDYGGGRSLLAAIDRGFHIVARPRTDRRVHLLDARSRQTFSGVLDPDLEQRPATWSAYPVTVLRRLARDFPDAAIGMDAVIVSTLPSAAGLSSSSALVIATLLPLVSFNRLDRNPLWREHCGSNEKLADYAGATENGRALGPFPADFGVGTHGGSQDHAAILCCTAGHLARIRFRPTRVEQQVPFPDDWCFVIASCGIPAPKGGAVQNRYNALAHEASALIEAWGDERITSLLEILRQPDGEANLIRVLAGRPDGDRLSSRLAQFREETTELIPDAAAALERGDADGFGAAVRRSHALGDAVLANQIDATRFLARLADELGAFGASGFGAGFGGSVYAVVDRDRGDLLRDSWQSRYQQEFPGPAERAEFFVARPVAGAHEI